MVLRDRSCRLGRASDDTTVKVAWADGLQPGLTGPAALLLSEDAELIRAASKAAYQVFEDIDKLKRHIADKILDNPYLMLPEWAQTLSEPAIPIAEWIVDHELHEPVVGHDVQNAASGVVGEFELPWPRHRIGVWAKGGGASPLPETLVGWHLYTVEELREAPWLLMKQHDAV